MKPHSYYLHVKKLARGQEMTDAQKVSPLLLADIEVIKKKDALAAKLKAEAEEKKNSPELAKVV